MRRPTLAIEKRLWKKGFENIAGIDEVGRGSLAGPVVAAAVVFPRMEKIPAHLRVVRDSKTLTARQREKSYPVILTSCLAWAVGAVSHRLIDRLNIVRATFRAMQKSCEKLAVRPDHLLIDGLVSRDQGSVFAIRYLPFVRGDSRVFSIAAASIIAKVTRDRLMRRLDKKYPQYGFVRHKGYGTRAHYAALREHGPCAIHRRSFYLGEAS